MNKIFLLLITTTLFSSYITAQVGGYGNNGRNNNQAGWNNDQRDQRYDDVYNQNPYNDPNYYPNQGNGNYGPPPPKCNSRPQVVVVPPVYCRPVVINPYPVLNFGFGYRNYNYVYGRNHGYGRGYGRGYGGHHGGHGRRW